MSDSLISACIVAPSEAALDDLAAVIDALGAEGFVVSAIVGSVGSAARPDVDVLDLLARPGVSAASAAFAVLVARLSTLRPAVVIDAVDGRHGVVVAAARAAGCAVVVSLVSAASIAPWRARLRDAIDVAAPVLERVRSVLPERVRGVVYRVRAGVMASRVVALNRAVADVLARDASVEPRLIRLDAGLGVAVDELPGLEATAALRVEARRRLGVDVSRRLVVISGHAGRLEQARRSLVRLDVSVQIVTIAESTQRDDATMSVVASDVLWCVGGDSASVALLMAAAVARVATVVADEPLYRALVRDGETARVAQTAALGAQRVLELLDRADERSALGARAQRHALRVFDRDLAARRIIEVVRAAAGGVEPSVAGLGRDGTIGATRPGARELLG